jgi:hypothetical protein
MNPFSMFPTRRVFCFAALLFSAQLLPQTPAQPGILRITSNSDGASIFIASKLMSQKTPAALVVAPGTYTVSVSGNSGKTNCPATAFHVSSGETAEHYCSGTTWTTKSN